MRPIPPRSLAHLLSITAALVAFAGCKGNDSAAGKAVDAGGADGLVPVAGSPNDVTGISADIHVTDKGDITVPAGPETCKVAALIPEGDGFRTIEGVVTADGHFTIPNVPMGRYYFRYTPLPEDGVGPTLLVTSERAIDLTGLEGGRPDAVAAQQETPLTVGGDGLDPWQEYDRLELFSLGAGTYTPDLFQVGGAKPTTGATTLMGLRGADVSLFATPNLSDASRGDRVLVIQRRIDKAVSVLSPAPFTQTEGEPVTISGTFEKVRETTLVGEWDVPAFAALAKDCHPEAQVGSSDLDIEAETGGRGRRIYVAYPAAVYHTWVPPEDIAPGGSFDTHFETSYANPFPATWPLIATVATYFRLPPYIPPGATEPTLREAVVAVRMPIEELTRGRVAPRLSPPRNIRIAGKSAYADLTGVGLAPTVEWDPPAVGTAAGYWVSIIRADVEYDHSAGIGTQDTSVTIPPGILKEGVRYFIKVGAITVFSRSAPFRDEYTGPQASADGITSLFTP